MEQNNNNEQNEELDMNHLMEIRREKLKELQEAGKNPLKLQNMKGQIQQGK